MTAGAPAADRYRGQQYRRLLAAARRSLERTGGQLTGRISLTQPDDGERKAVIGITGVHQPAGARRLTVTLADLDAALRRGTGMDLAAVLAALGPPVRDRPAEAASLAAARAAAIRGLAASPLHDSAGWYRDWLADLSRDGTITRLVSSGAATALTDAAAVLEFLAARRADALPLALPELAAIVAGDTKALSHPGTLATLVLRALALRTGTSRPAAAADRRELWEAAGVIVDDLASRVLVLNVRADGDGLGEWLTGAARYGTPFQVTLHQLAAHPVRLRLPQLFACENPAILRRACEELGAACPPLACTEGMPSTAFQRLARTAVAAGAVLRYHGDFDWPGVAIATDILARYDGRPWRLGAADYLAGAQGSSSRVPLAGEARPTPWDPALAEAMRATGQAVFEEVVADQLLADLAGGRPPSG